MEIYSCFYVLIALLFSIYPNNIFSLFEQHQLLLKTNATKEINKDLLKKGLDRILPEEVLKVECFSKQWLNFYGHSLLIKKINENEYIFFDPNKGEKRNLTFNSLVDEINNLLWSFNDIYLSRGSDFLKLLN